MKPRRLRAEEFTVGWICALHIELSAAIEALDEEYEQIGGAAHYTLGRIGKHNIVVACLPGGQLGTNSAAVVAAQMQITFPTLQYGFMVGIAGGVPSKTADIRLGDVVISHPQGQYAGVVQYDFGKTGSGGQHLHNGSLNAPHPVLLRAVAVMRSAINTGRCNISLYMSALNRHNLFPRPGPGFERLFDASYNHVVGETCDGCLEDRVLNRLPRPNQDVIVHYGIVASGNQVIKDGLTRDRISAQHGGVLCFEMEAAGLMNNFPYLVVRGICDYADSHKHKGWQPYAAAAASACAKAVLSFVPTVSPSVGGEFDCRSLPRLNSMTESEIEVSSFMDFASAQSDADESRLGPLSLYTKSSPLEEQWGKYHQSLRFEDIDARHATIQDAHSETCWWLLAQAEYQNWLDIEKYPEHHGLLWIKGNVGTGKSTIMKFALTTCTKSKTPNDVIIKFFFNARGDELEKSVVGMYRSLLFQLFDEIPALKHLFALRPPKPSKDRTTAPPHEPNTYLWDVGSLQSLFGHAVKSLGNRGLICFIDALDECDEYQIREMVTFLEHLGDLAASSNLKMHICLSSMHYPNITVEHGIFLILEDQEGHADDIAKYVDSKLKGVRSTLLNDVKREICERSSGIFLWVVLVVQVLKKDLDSGQIQVLKKRLKEIPRGLNKLFDEILIRDTYDNELLILCLQWLLFARRPLKPIELFYAVLAGVEPESITSLDPENIDGGTLENFVRNASKGLAEITKGETENVQFIHESVRYYLLQTDFLPRLRGALPVDFSGITEERFKTCCQDYISIVISQETSSNRSRDSLTELVGKGAHLASKRHPFLEYAVRNILFRADAAAGNNLQQNGFFDKFPSKIWASLSNLFVKEDSQRYGPSPSLLYIFANECTPNLISFEVQRNPLIDIKGGYYGFPLNAAVAHGSRESLEALLLAQDSLHSAIKAADTKYHVAPEKREAAIHNCFARFKDRRGTLLCWATKQDDIDLVKMLLNTAKVALNLKDELGWTPLSRAASNGNIDMVRLLLETGRVDVKIGGRHNDLVRTPLSLAAGGGHVAVVKLLLATGNMDIESKDESHRTCISWAASNGHAAVTKLLFEFWEADMAAKGRSPDRERLALNAKDPFGATPLHGAILVDAVEVVRFLASIDEVDLEATNGENETPIQMAQREELVQVAEVLLQAHLDRLRRRIDALKPV